MRLFMMAFLAVAVLGGGGAGAYFYFKQPAQAAISATGEHKKAADAKSSKAKGGEHKFVQLDPLVLPIIDETGVTQVVSMVVAIEVTDDKKASTVKNLSPRLKDAYIQELYGVLNKHAAMQGGVIQVNVVKSQLHEISDRVLGEDMIEDVLLQVVQQRPI